MNLSIHPRIGSTSMLAMAGLFIALKETPDIEKLNPIFVEIIKAGLSIMVREDYIQGGF
jgi:hypothetical protein